MGLRQLLYLINKTNSLETVSNITMLNHCSCNKANTIRYCNRDNEQLQNIIIEGDIYSHDLTITNKPEVIS